MPQRTERIRLKPSFNLMQYSHKSKNLYNYANYIFRNQLQNNHFTSEYEMMEIIRHHPTYEVLPAHTAQQTIKFLVKAWRGYFKALKEYKKKPLSFLGKPQSPGYKRRDGFHTLYFTANQVRIRNGLIQFPRLMGLEIKTRLDVRIKHVRIIPRGTSFLLELVYERETKALRPVKNIVAVDLGVNNLIAAVSNVSVPILISVRPLKSMNQWSNKEDARLSSVYQLQNPGLKYAPYGMSMFKLLEGRYWRVENYLHKASRLLIDECVKNRIDTIVIGYNEGWKQRSSMGKRNNQNFVNIPFLNLLRKIEYKAEDAGIRVIRTGESYTSKCSFLDNEEIRKHRSYMGKRVSRGLFRSSSGVEINADYNAAANIGRKVFPMKFFYGTVDAVSHPVCLSTQG